MRSSFLTEVDSISRILFRKDSASNLVVVPDFVTCAVKVWDFSGAYSQPSLLGDARQFGNGVLHELLVCSAISAVLHHPQSFPSRQRGRGCRENGPSTDDVVANDPGRHDQERGERGRRE